MRFQRTLFAALGLAAALLVSAPAHAVGNAPGAVGGTPPSVVGGGYSSYTYGAVKQFRNGAEWCTASQIAPSWILTAQHCVSASASYSYRIGSTDAYSGGTTVTASYVYQHPQADLALVQLSRPVSGTYTRLGSTSVGQNAQIYGWGSTCPSDQCQSRYLKYANTRVFSTNSRDGRGGVAIGVQRVDGIIAGGDSGGPVFAGGYQVGVASTSDRANYAYYTSTTAYRSWIRNISGV
ncbi:trypsin-like serine protease [Longispora sp. NPDC051575]|uniref:S1 family peptidase n=1 Tax=Longispora sp. NPDC051575 TaxID=3154943 RepID=UPI00342F881E